MSAITITGLTTIIIGVLISVGISIFAMYKKSLSKSGMIAALFMGVWISVFGGFYFIVVLLSFFISSSLLSRLFNQTKYDSLRGYKQVFANGSVAMFMVFLYAIDHEGPYRLLYTVSIAVSTADTWAGEIGRLSKIPPRDILSRKIVPNGLSGGVTTLGYLASLSGSFFISIFLYFNPFVIIFGFLGSILDSVMGTFQVKYITEDGTVLDELNDSAIVSTTGYSWLTNNMVNLLSNFIIVFFVYSILLFL